ncbi:MAG: hypothetical protein ACYDFU_03230, partial [Nitrospirota bacterium]
AKAQAAAMPNPKADAQAAPKIAEAKAMMDSGQVRQAAQSCKEICSADPSDASAYALYGQVCSRLQDYPDAVKEFRMCLSLDADYADSKSSKFIGKIIKATIKECKPQFKQALSKNPGDKVASASMENVHYLERMLAGGCD